jgi:hypothetical protein
MDFVMLVSSSKGIVPTGKPISDLISRIQVPFLNLTSYFIMCCCL